MDLQKINKKIIGVAVFVLTFILFWPAIHLNIPQPAHSVDTVFSKREPTLNIIKNKNTEQPISVVKYKPSKKTRDSVEKAPIITNIRIYKPLFSDFKKMDIVHIDTMGLAYKNTYNLSDFKEINIDHSGKVEIKRKKKLLLKVAYIAIPIIVTSIGLKYSYDKWQKKH